MHLELLIVTTRDNLNNEHFFLHRILKALTYLILQDIHKIEIKCMYTHNTKWNVIWT